MDILEANLLDGLARDATLWIDLAGKWAIGNGLRILLVLCLIVLAVKVGARLMGLLFSRISRGRDVEYCKRIDTLHSIVAFTLKAGLTTIGVFVVLGQLGIDIAPILAAAGILGLAVGFGAQTLVQDVISGFFLLVEDQVRVGDVVQIGDKGGLVEKITLRLIVLRDMAGNVHYIRNGTVGVVTNMTKDYSRYVFDIGVAYKEDVDRVIEVVKKVDEDMRADPEFGRDILDPIEILGVDRFEDSAVVIRARTKTVPIRQWAVGREFNKRLKKRFDTEGIEIPFPHRTIYWGEGHSPREQRDPATPRPKPAEAGPAQSSAAPTADSEGG